MTHPTPSRLPAAAAAAAILLLCACGGAAPPFAASVAVRGREARLQVRTVERYYPVAGRSAEELNVQLARRGPRLSGRPAHGLTEWKLRWSYDPMAGDGSCRPSRLRVRVELVTLLPRWTGDGEAPAPDLRGQWRLFIARLRHHEEGHRSIAVAAARELVGEVDRLRAPSCDGLREDIERAARRLERRHLRRHESWDREAEHGASG